MRREIINRFSLCEQFPIETWQKIAEATSLLELQDANNEKEFKKNLRILKQSIIKTEVSLDEGSRYTKNFMEIGTSTLLQAIYDIKVSDKKKHLIEQINILKELGIKHIRS